MEGYNAGVVAERPRKQDDFVEVKGRRGRRHGVRIVILGAGATKRKKVAKMAVKFTAPTKAGQKRLEMQLPEFLEKHLHIPGDETDRDVDEDGYRMLKLEELMKIQKGRRDELESHLSEEHIDSFAKGASAATDSKASRLVDLGDHEEVMGPLARTGAKFKAKVRLIMLEAVFIGWKHCCEHSLLDDHHHHHHHHHHHQTAHGHLHSLEHTIDGSIDSMDYGLPDDNETITTAGVFSVVDYRTAPIAAVSNVPKRPPRPKVPKTSAGPSPTRRETRIAGPAIVVWNGSHNSSSSSTSSSSSSSASSAVANTTAAGEAWDASALYGGDSLDGETKVASVVTASSKRRSEAPEAAVWRNPGCSAKIPSKLPSIEKMDVFSASPYSARVIAPRSQRTKEAPWRQWYREKAAKEASFAARGDADGDNSAEEANGGGGGEEFVSDGASPSDMSRRGTEGSSTSSRNNLSVEDFPEYVDPDEVVDRAGEGATTGGGSSRSSSSSSSSSSGGRPSSKTDPTPTTAGVSDTSDDWVKATVAHTDQAIVQALEDMDPLNGCPAAQRGNVEELVRKWHKLQSGMNPLNIDWKNEPYHSRETTLLQCATSLLEARRINVQAREARVSDFRRARMRAPSFKLTHFLQETERKMDLILAVGDQREGD